jgi:AraC-like DNA-binding protein
MGTAAEVESGAATAADATVAAGFVRALADLAVAKGAGREELLRRAGIAPGEIEDPDRRVRLARYQALMHAGQELARDPALALHFGEAFDITELSIVGLMGQACATVADAFALLGRFTRLAIDVPLEEGANGQRLMVQRTRAGLWLVDTRKDPNLFPELTESSFARMVSSARRLGGASFVKAVHFTHQPPAYRDEYDRIFGAPLVFGSDRNALLMSGDSWMNLRAPLPSPYLFRILAERAEALLEELDQAKTVRGRVEKMLAPLLHEREVRMTAVASRLGFSRATLSRRLKAEGTTFEAVQDALRHRLSLDYLRARGLSVSETAYLVGFADPAAFSRAFKRWTGRSPRDARPGE